MHKTLFNKVATVHLWTRCPDLIVKQQELRQLQGTRKLSWVGKVTGGTSSSSGNVVCQSSPAIFVMNRRLSGKPLWGCKVMFAFSNLFLEQHWITGSSNRRWKPKKSDKAKKNVTKLKTGTQISYLPSETFLNVSARCFSASSTNADRNFVKEQKKRFNFRARRVILFLLFAQKWNNTHKVKDSNKMCRRP